MGTRHVRFQLHREEIKPSTNTNDNRKKSRGAYVLYGRARGFCSDITLRVASEWRLLGESSLFGLRATGTCSTRHFFLRQLTPDVWTDNVHIAQMLLASLPHIFQRNVQHFNLEDQFDTFVQGGRQ